MRVPLDDVKAKNLNGACLTLIAKFSQELKSHHGIVLSLQNPYVVKEIVQHTTRTQNPELRRLCNLLLKEIRSHLSGGAAVGSDVQATPPAYARRPSVEKPKRSRRF